MKFIHRFRITRPVTCKNIYLIAHFHIYIYTRFRVFKIVRFHANKSVRRIMNFYFTYASKARIKRYYRSNYIMRCVKLH